RRRRRATLFPYTTLFRSEVARGQSRPLEGPLQLGIIPTIAPFLLPRVLPALRKRYPKLKLFLREDTTEKLHEQLLDGTLDVVVLDRKSTRLNSSHVKISY